MREPMPTNQPDAAALIAEVREELAALAHEQWAGWMRYLFSRCEGPLPDWSADGLLMPIEWVKRWERQMNTPYADLREDEKASDRKEADRVIEKVQHIIGRALQQERDALKAENERLTNPR